MRGQEITQVAPPCLRLGYSVGKRPTRVCLTVSKRLHQEPAAKSKQQTAPRTPTQLAQRLRKANRASNEGSRV